VLGLGQASVTEYKTRTRERRLRNRRLDPADVGAKVKARNDARENRDFARADALRDELAALGVELYDTPTGTAWSVAV
jgi:cysteinyl-tRNA synthetase